MGIDNEIEHKLLLLAIFELLPLVHVLQPTLTLNFHSVEHCDGKDRDPRNHRDGRLFEQKHLCAPHVPDFLRYTEAVHSVDEVAFEETACKQVVANQMVRASARRKGRGGKEGIRRPYHIKASALKIRLQGSSRKLLLPYSVQGPFITLALRWKGTSLPSDLTIDLPRGYTCHQ